MGKDNVLKKFRGVFIKNENEIEIMAVANGMVACILEQLISHVEPGRSTMFFEELTVKLCQQLGVKPGFLGMYGYPFALCISVNEVIVHGMPSNDVILKEGDIVSFDVGVYYKGFYGDAARTAYVGTVSEEADRLVITTRECLERAIEMAKPGNDLLDISHAVQSYAEEKGYKVIRRFVGHGIGANLHEKPEVPNFVPSGNRCSLPLKAGMVLALEPMLAIGTYEVDILKDGWTAVTKDRSLAAHWENTIVITSNGARILSDPANYPQFNQVISIG